MDLQDLKHRVVWTFVQAFTGSLSVTSLTDSLLDLDLGLLTVVLMAAATAGVGDVLVVLKEYARQQLGDPDVR